MAMNSIRRCLVSGVSLWTRQLFTAQRAATLAHPAGNRRSFVHAPDIGKAYRLSYRSMVKAQGVHTIDLLQGLVTSDVEELKAINLNPACQFAMMLNKQGRVLCDLILYKNYDPKAMEECILVEVDDSLKHDFMQVLKAHKGEKRVEITDVSNDYQIWCIPSNLDPSQSLMSKSHAGAKRPVNIHNALFCLPDPRVPSFGFRVVFKGDQGTVPWQDAGYAEYRALRYRWGIPEGPTDLPPGNCLPLESNLAIMNGVSFFKGGYVGQEATAQSRGDIRKRLVPLFFESAPPVLGGGFTIESKKGENAGAVRDVAGNYGLGLVGLEHQGEPLTVNTQDGAKVHLCVYTPGWWPDDISS